MKKLLISISLLAALCSCHHDDDPEDNRARRTVFVYMAAENNLARFADDDLSEMQTGSLKLTDDDNLVVYVETNCADYCTGSGNQCNNCGQYVSGANSYPSFNVTNTTGTLCQKKSGNTTAAMVTGTYTNVSKRINARFTLANLDCGSEKVPIYIHVPDIPDYDVETQELLYPTTSCALYNEHIQVQLKNMLNTPIPANKVVIHAVFNGSEVTHTVDEPFSPEEVKVVEFTTPPARPICLTVSSILVLILSLTRFWRLLTDRQTSRNITSTMRRTLPIRFIRRRRLSLSTLRLHCMTPWSIGCLERRSRVTVLPSVFL